ncbi:MAG TPA: DUF1559 domain-containing protein [Pirellulaceae bacterium]|nr:DUF1559 domain-containing protein [Pirellulaceae bacterium]
MTFSFRILLTLGLALLPLIGLAQERNAAQSKLDAIAPFLDDQTIAVGRLDLKQVDLQAGIDFFAKDIPVDLFSPQQRKEVVAKLTDLKDKLLAAGTSEVFFIYSLQDLPHDEPLVVFPVGKGGDPKRVQEALAGLTPDAAPVGESLHGAIVLAPRGIKTVKATLRPDLAKAFAAGGNAPVQVVLSASDDTRRALRESLPAMPAELGGLSGAELVDSFGSLTLAANPPPQPSLSVTLKAKDARAAAQLGVLANSALDLLTKNEQAQRDLPGIEQIVSLLQPKVEADRLVLKLDEEQGNLTKIIDELVKPAVVSARAAANRAQSGNNLKQMMIGLHTYHDTHRSFPPQASRKDDKKLLSWRVHLLPYLEQKELYDQFHLDEPWDSEHNKKLIEKMPQVFAGQGLTEEQVKKGMTNYLVPVGPKTVFEGAAATRFADIRDGTSNTIAVVESSPEHAVVWTSPEDWRVDFSKPFVGLREKATGFLCAFCDGSVHSISDAVDWETVRRLLQKDDGEPVGEF